MKGWSAEEHWEEADVGEDESDSEKERVDGEEKAVEQEADVGHVESNCEDGGCEHALHEEEEEDPSGFINFETWT